MKLYVSGTLTLVDHRRMDAAILEMHGHIVTSNWLYEPELRVTDPDHEEWEERARANEDVEDIIRADAIVLYTEGVSTSGGRDTEYGIALGLRKRLFVIDGGYNVFHRRAEAEHFETTMDLIDHLRDEGRLLTLGQGARA